jgi:transcriptional regulator with XRE-family HTH domain
MVQQKFGSLRSEMRDETLVTTPGQRVRALREAAGLKETELAAKLGVSQQAIKNMESAGVDNYPSFPNGLKLGRIFGVAPEWIAFGEAPAADLKLVFKDGAVLTIDARFTPGSDGLNALEATHQTVSALSASFRDASVVNTTGWAMRPETALAGGGTSQVQSRVPEGPIADEFRALQRQLDALSDRVAAVEPADSEAKQEPPHARRETV